jgi:hypothetical protein
MVATKVTYDQSAMHMAALVILLDRIGGSLTFTEAEYQAVVARHGGKTMMAIHAEVIKTAGAERPDQVRLTLTRKPPGNAELPS